jgi:hypothetical protein
MPSAGQTLDKCLDKVRSCNQSHMASLQSILATVKEPQFVPDLNWINQNLIKAGAQPMQVREGLPAMSKCLALQIKMLSLVEGWDQTFQV